jgi:hypothetical protein
MKHNLEQSDDTNDVKYSLGTRLEMASSKEKEERKRGKKRKRKEPQSSRSQENVLTVIQIEIKAEDIIVRREAAR